jgi:hypothetical protein
MPGLSLFNSQTGLANLPKIIEVQEEKAKQGL